MEDLHKNASKSSSLNKFLNGKGIREYSSGHKIEGHWVQGRPEGKAFLTTPNESVEVEFKKGLIRRIFTEKEILSVHFPYKFMKIDGGFQEIFEDSSKNWFSVLKLPMKYDFCERAVNKKLENIRKIIIGDEYIFYGKTFEMIPLGYGISIEGDRVLVGFFNGINFVGYMAFGIKIYKGSFDDLMLNGYGMEKVNYYNIKYKGNFYFNSKEGHFDVFFQDFRAEATFKNNHHLKPVKFFKGSKFLIEADTDNTIFNNNQKYFHIPEMIELDFKFKISILENQKYSKEALRNNPQNNSFKFSLKSEDWITYEKSLLKTKPISTCSFQMKNIISSDLEKDSIENENLLRIRKYIVSDCEYYIGYLKNQKRENFGYFYKHGKILYKGYWKHDQFHGTGLLFSQGYKISGKWEEGKLKHINYVLRYE